jgi:hypothetical protein
MADEKKHKSGYELLKEKYAALEAKNAELQKEKEILVQTAQDNYCRVEKERDEWKANCEHYKQESEYFHGQFRNELDINTGKDKRIAFLLDHCPFWVLWMYSKQFEKGGKE